MSNLAAIRTRAPQAAHENEGGIVALASTTTVLEQIRALNALGEFKQALAQCPAAAGALQALNDCDGVARVWQEAAWAESYLGHLDQAEEYLGRALAAGGGLPELQLKGDWIGARILREQGESRHALRVFKRLHAAYLNQGAKAEAMHVLIELGHTQLKLRTRNALEPLKRARRYFVRTKSPLQVVLCDFMLAQAQIDLNRFDRADAALRRAQKISREHGARFMDASCDLEIGYLGWATDRFQEMLERSSRACELFKELGVTQEISSAEVNIGVALLELTRYDEAIPYLEKGLESALESGRKIKAAVILLNLSYIRVKQGQYARALENLQRARAFLAKVGNVERLITCDLHMAAFYLHVGADDDAKRAIERAAGAASKESMKTRQAQSDLYRALWYRKRGHFRRAAAALERARACFLRQRKTAHVAFSDRLLAEIPSQSDATALARLAASRAIFERQRQVIDTALCDMVRGELLLRGKERAEAGRAFKQAQSRLEHFPAYAARVSYGLARVLEQDQPHEARRYYRDAARTIAQARGETGLESVSNSFYRARQSMVTDGLAFAHGQGAPKDALALVEAAKAQLFVHALAPRTWKPGTAQPREGELREREEKLRYLLDRRRQQLTWQEESENEGMRGSGSRRGTRAKLGELARLEREYEVVVGELRLTHRGLGGLPSLAPFELEKFRAAAYSRWGENWVALDYYLARGRLYIVLVEPQQVRLIVRPWERLDQHLLGQATDTRRDVRELIYNGTLHRIPVPDRFDPLVPLADKLIPGELSGRADTHLLIAPNGLLHQLPLHALPFGGQRLVERFTISYIPSLQAFAHLAQAPKFAVPLKMLVCGADEFGGREAPLEHSRAEVRALKGLLGSGEVLWQADATRAAVLERNRSGALEQFDVLHFATHAVIEQDAPHTSRVVLTDADLTVLDILDLNLNAELVTLSACSSHLGTGGGGDEWIGLARAFYYAGARALVASLWEVEDAVTTGLMRKMYQRIGAGDSPAMALRRAQGEAIGAGVMPYHWAAFTVSGAI